MRITIEDLVESFGATAEDIPTEVKDLLISNPLEYEILEGKDKEEVILKVLKKIYSDQQKVGTEERKGVWFRGWRENLDAYRESRDLKDLTPKFIRPNSPIRFKGNFIQPTVYNFELDFFHLFRIYLFKKYFKDFKYIYDFGCGSCFNTVILAALFPDSTITALDFVSSSMEIVDELKKDFSNIQGHLFDLTLPNYNVKLEEESLVFTSGTIEQVASKFYPFLNYLLHYKPKLCVHIEPVIELYDENNLLDYLAILFHRKRGYSIGFLPALYTLVELRKAEILKVKRLHFGSMMMEGFTNIIWRPL